MSRAINVDVPAAAVIAMCTRHQTKISCLERLPHGATRVVLVTSDGAATIRGAFADSLLPERTKRFPQWSPERTAL